MKKIGLGLLMIVLLTACQTQKPKEKELVHFKELEVLTLDQVDEFLANKESGILYFGWVTNCGDSNNFQDNYLEDKLANNPELKNQIKVVDLDQEVPEALMNKDLRQPLIDKYTVGYSPTLLAIENGEIVVKVEWQLKTSDPVTAIPEETLDKFFDNYKD